MGVGGKGSKGVRAKPTPVPQTPNPYTEAMPETLFNLANLLPLPVWLSMMLFPRTPFTQRLVTSYWPFTLLSSLYALFLVIALATGDSGFDLSFDGLREGFGGEWTFLAAWLHYLAFDLFVGVWLFRDAKYWNLNPLPFLILTLFAGPLGLGSYLLWRQRQARSDPSRRLN